MSARKILIAEDDPRILELYRLIFSGEDLSGDGINRGSGSTVGCITYADPRQMVRDYRHMYEQGRQISLCILDMRMPKQNGLVTAEQLRAIDPEIDIVVSSAYDDFGSAEIRARLRERVYFVRKPFDYEVISLMVESLVDSWEMRQELRRESAFLTGLIEASHDLIFMKDPEGVYLTCNQRFAAFAKCPRDKVIGGTDCDFLPQEVCTAFREQDRQVIESGKSLTYRETVDDPDGGRCLLETIKSPVFSDKGKVMGILGIARDISKRRGGDTEDAI
jgi:PAS domain S-box-containing protein